MQYPGGTWSEHIYCYIHNIREIPKCPICGNPIKYHGKLGYGKWRSCKCMNSDPNKKQRMKDTCMKKYGAENPFASEEIQQKIISTNISQLGVKYPTQSAEVREKVKKSVTERYGGFTMQSPILREKMEKTCLDRYGAENIFASEKFKNDTRQSNIDRISDLIGYTKDGDWICKCPHPETCNKCREKYYIIPKEHQPSTLYNRRKGDNIEPCIRLLPIQSTFSAYELHVRSWLDDLNIEYISNDRSVLDGKELDIYIPGNHLAIEINGCYWYSNAYKSKSYHVDKWSQCKENGIKMVTLWEDWIQDYPDSCKQLIMYHLGLINTINIPWDSDLVDLGLKSGSIKEHLSIHDGYECWDTGLFI